MSGKLPTHKEFLRLASWVNEPDRIDLPVLIDGYMLAGKTYLAEALAAEIGGQAIDADKYLERRQDAYIPSLDVSALKAAFQKAERPILSGVCMRQIHQILGKPPCSHVDTSLRLAHIKLPPRMRIIVILVAAMFSHVVHVLIYAFWTCTGFAPVT